MTTVPGSLTENLQRGIKSFNYGVSFAANEYYYKINKFGANPSCGTSFEDTWDGAAVDGAETMTLQTSAVTCGVSSDDDEDTSDGDGARTVMVYGIDGNWDYQNEVVIMNGQTKVETSKQYLFIYRKKVLTVGVTLVNEGNIYAYDTASAISSGVPQTATDLMSMITLLKGQTLMAHFPVGAGYKAYIDKWECSSGDLQARYFDAELVVKPFEQAWQVKHSFGNSGGLTERTWDRPSEIDEKSIIKIRTDCSASMPVHGSFDVLLIDENRYTTRQTI